MNNDIILNVIDLTKIYRQADNIIKVLENTTFSIKKNSINIISGKSGSGKSTLLHLIGGLDKPDSGAIFFNDLDITKLTDNRLNELRNLEIGFVFQFHHLLMDFTAFENILIPVQINEFNIKSKKEFALELMNKLGIYERRGHFPNQLSGGEQQRAAICRALINNPKLLLADEPTGNLDNDTAGVVFDLFWKINDEYKTTIIIVTHDSDISNKPHKKFYLNNGKLNEYIKEAK
ncbi:MAG TPA: ABC transporter ATP-binding protein [bacterium]|nr:ABC transporter ATP-binding protein [bacterium]HPP87261.1 ABC transporter ATP-binding protein [bacterium]